MNVIMENLAASQGEEKLATASLRHCLGPPNDKRPERRHSRQQKQLEIAREHAIRGWTTLSAI